MANPKTERAMQSAHKRMRRHMVALDEAKADLLQAVQLAREEKMSLAAIAESLGVSKSRAQQLVRQADGRGRSR